MKLSLLALAALPVLAGGLVIAAAVAGLGSADAPAPTPIPMLGTSGGDRAGSGNHVNTDTGTDASTDAAAETEIDGRRPHLTVIDGRHDLALPGGAIPAALSILAALPAPALPLPARDLPPLADLEGDLAWPTGGDDSPGRAAPGAGRPDEPGAGGIPVDRADVPPPAQEPGSPPPREPGAAPPAVGAPRPAAPPDHAATGQPRPDARPPATGRPARPSSELVDHRVPSDPAGSPGQDDATGPPVSEPGPVPPTAEPVVPDLRVLRKAAETVPADTVPGENTDEGARPDVSRPSAE